MRHSRFLILGLTVLLVSGGPAASSALKSHDSAADTQLVPVDTAMARALFQRFKSLDGKWEGRSTRGWEDSVTWRTIAGGSVVMSTSFEAHPGETMVTMHSLDVGRLLLTHYCVAGNQPRLVATACTPDGKTVDFTFLDGGNMASRDEGHMDRAVMRFHDDGTVSSKWTWYQQGKEQWMEEIQYRRLLSTQSQRRE